jgi:hypothetical protein
MRKNFCPVCKKTVYYFEPHIIVIENEKKKKYHKKCFNDAQPLQ